jgi:hypothetical protein
VRQQFDQLTAILKAYQDYWRHDPFIQIVSGQLPWQSQHPALSEWLSECSPEHIQTLKQSPLQCAEALSPFIPELHALQQAAVIDSIGEASHLTLPRGLDSGVPGRKLEQIRQMGSACIHNHHGSEWLEWCSGKGFLGRILSSQTEQKVTSFEYQQALCDAGQHEANRRGLSMQFVQGDAFDESSKQVFNANQHAVALHACGDLHVTLIHHAIGARLPALTLSPCCYHLIQDEQYQPLSELGRQAELSLTKQELRIPLQETVTGGERVKRHREQEMVFRLGFDALCQQNQVTEGYEPVPSIKKSQLSDGFEHFCHWAAAQKSLTIPQVDFEHFEQVGQARFWEMEALSLVQSVFRRPLEVWLALDKALYLKSHGYQVSLSTFCDTATTPRNIMLHAFKS